MTRFIYFEAIQFQCCILIRNWRKCRIHVVRSACIFPVGKLIDSLHVQTEWMLSQSSCHISLGFHQYKITISLPKIWSYSLNFNPLATAMRIATDMNLGCSKIYILLKRKCIYWVIVLLTYWRQPNRNICRQRIYEIARRLVTMLEQRVCNIVNIIDFYIYLPSIQ